MDFVWPFDGKLIPIEVKSGTEGKLKSLHLYMDLVAHQMALRFYAGEIIITEAVTPGGKEVPFTQFTLLSCFPNRSLFAMVSRAN